MKNLMICAVLALTMACGNNDTTDKQRAAADTTNLSPDAITPSPNETDLNLAALKLPPGFKMGVFASGIEDARSLARGDKGTIFVGNRGKDKVWAVRDEDGDGKADKKWTIAEGLTMPNGVAFRRRVFLKLKKWCSSIYALA